MKNVLPKDLSVITGQLWLTDLCVIWSEHVIILETTKFVYWFNIEIQHVA